MGELPAVEQLSVESRYLEAEMNAFLQRTRNDVRRGENLDAYATIAVALVVAMSNTFYDCTAGWPRAELSLALRDRPRAGMTDLRTDQGGAF